MYQIADRQYPNVRAVALAILTEDPLACNGHMVFVREAGLPGWEKAAESLEALLSSWGFYVVIGSTNALHVLPS